MIFRRTSGLAAFAEDLASTGTICFTRQNAMDALGISHGAFLDAAERLAKRGYIFAPRRGFYVITPMRFLNWGAPPPNWYIDRMMKVAGQPYYVGLLKAAELHGSAHQAVMEFQVVTDRQWRPIRAGRSRIAFYYRKDCAPVEAGITQCKTTNGSMCVSSPGLTALDLIRYPQASGGPNHAASVLNELAPEIDPEQLQALAPAFERSVVQRLGYVLDQLGYDELTAVLRNHVESGNRQWVELEPGNGCTIVTGEAPHRDQRWNVVIRRPLEIDEQ